MGQPTIGLAGWNQAATIATQIVTTIHHPRGDVKKISSDNEPLGTGSANFWTIDQWDSGLVESGSSGCALFDATNRIIGQLHGGDVNIGCTAVPGGSLVDNNTYGRFNVSWTGGGTNSTRLSNWLDPGLTAPTTTNTIRVPSISGSNTVCSGSSQTFTLNDIIPGRTALWSVSPSSLVVTSGGSGTTAVLQANSSSSVGLATLDFILSAGAGSGCNPVHITRQFWVGKPDIGIEGDDYLCTGDRGFAEIIYKNGTDEIMQGITGVSWTFNGPLATFAGYPGHASYRAGGSAGYGTIGVTATNACGTSQANLPYTVIDCDGGGKDMVVKVFPNPISGTTKIEITGKPTKNVEKFDLCVYDRLGNKVLSKVLPDREVQIDLSILEPGVYFIEVSADGIHLHERILKTW